MHPELGCRHLAASEGAYQVTEWLLTQRVDVNSLDRFKHSWRCAMAGGLRTQGGRQPSRMRTC